MTTLRLAPGYFVPWPNDAGSLVAAARDWYREAGIDVRHAVVDPLRGDTLEHLLDGVVDLAVAPTNRLFVRREAGDPLVAVAALNHRAMETVQTLWDRGITRPAELAGRRLALNPTPRGLAMVRHLVAVDGGDPDELRIVDSGTREVTVDDLADGLADAFFGGYWAWDAMFGTLPDAERVTWPVDTIGAPPYHSYVLVAHEDLWEREPELLERFLEITARGFHSAADDQAAALTVLERCMPWARPALLGRSLELVAPTWFHDGTWGVNRPELHAPYAEWLADNGILRDPGIWREAVRDGQPANPSAA